MNKAAVLIACGLAAFTTTLAHAGNDPAGNDRDLNGIRDEVDTVITTHYAAGPRQDAARQLARALQLSLWPGSRGKTTAKAVMRLIGNANSCVQSRFPADQAAEVQTRLKVATLDTKERRDGYDAFVSSFNGAVIIMDGGDACD